MPGLPNLVVRLTHTGVYADGRPNPTGILLKDINIGSDQQFRKHQVYIPSLDTIELTLTDWVMFSFLQGDIDGFIRTGQLTYELPLETALDDLNNTITTLLNIAGESTVSWAFETANTGIDYFGGFYQFGATDNDFSPSITFGDVNQARAAHFFVVVGAVPVDDVTISVTGTNVNDDGTRTPGLTATINIPSGTPVDTYFETPEKWNGQVTIETTAGTAITCNYGMCKYYDHNNRDFDIIGFETIWTSESNDALSDIRLIHHKAEGWTFNAGAEPDHPPHIYDRATDFAGDVKHVSGESGAWKRAALTDHIAGGDAEGIIWEALSNSAGIGAQSFRDLNAQLLLRTCVGTCTP